MINKQTLTVQELADYLQCHRNTVYKFIRNNDIPFLKIGKDYRFFKDEVIQALKTDVSQNG